MAIQMRRGLRKDFDPSRMLPGEWAVSIDSSTSNQIVWMCFSTGVCKRMGTYEDFQSMIYQATGEIIEQYEENFGATLTEVEKIASTVSKDKEEILLVKTDITDTYLPQIAQYVRNASTSESNAKTYASNAKTSAETAKVSEMNAKESEEKAKVYAENASAVTDVKIATKDVAGLIKGGENAIDEDGTLLLIRKTTDRTLSNSKPGGLKINEVRGVSEQDGTPTPEIKADINSVVISEIKAVGKNKYNPSKSTFEILAEDGTINSATGTEYILSDYIESNGNITVSTESYKGVCYIRVGLYDDNKKFISRKLLTLSSNEKSITVNNVGYIRICYENLTEQYLTNVKVEDGAEITPYEPYQEKVITLSEPITLRGIGNVRDVICKQDGVYGVVRNLKQFTFTSVRAFLNDTNTIRQFVDVTDNIGGAYALLCNALQVKDVYSVDEAGIFYRNIGNTFVIRLPKSVLSDETEAAFLQYLKDNVELWYVATPTFEPLPTADQIALHQLETFDTVTYISTNSEVEPIIEVEYGTSVVGGYALELLDEVNKLTYSLIPNTFEHITETHTATSGSSLSHNYAAKKTGMHHFYGFVSIGTNGNGTRRYVIMLPNGQQLLDSRQAIQDGETYLPINFSVYLEKGENIVMYVFQSSGDELEVMYNYSVNY